MVGYVAGGVALHALGIVMHEAIHGNFFRHKTLDRWVAFVHGIPILVSGAAYRVTHLMHHHDTRGPRDPDEFTNRIRNPRLLSLAFYGWAVLGMFIFLTHVPLTAWRYAGRDDRRVIAKEYAAIGIIVLGTVAGSLYLGSFDIVLHGWIVPLGVTFLIVNVRGWSEHMLTEPGNPMTHTRTITSNGAVSAAMLNLNYHVEHHLFPAVPWYNVPKIHPMLLDKYTKAGTPLYKSYGRFLWDAARRGFHGRAPSRQNES